MLYFWVGVEGWRAGGMTTVYMPGLLVAATADVCCRCCSAHGYFWRTWQGERLANTSPPDECTLQNFAKKQISNFKTGGGLLKIQAAVEHICE